MTKNKLTFARIYSLVKKIPKGKVATYGQIAKILGGKKGAQVVGWALHSNPDPDKIPCHRVVNREGRLSDNFGLPGGWQTQKKKLVLEGVKVNNKKVDLAIFQWNRGKI